MKTEKLIVFILSKYCGFSDRKAKTISSRFDSLEAFLDAKLDFFRTISDGRNKLLSKNDLEALESMKRANIISRNNSLSENFIVALGVVFLKRQVKMIEELTLDDLNANPILLSALKLDTPRKIIEYYVYQASSRSIITSMGFLVQDLLLHSSLDTLDGNNEQIQDAGTKWDLIKKKDKGKNAFIEVKSGPNDIDKTQLLHYRGAIISAENHGNRAYIGETYGRRDQNTVTHGLYRSYLESWENRTLIGRELWDFITDDTHFHQNLLQLLTTASERVLVSKSIVQKIKDCVDRIEHDFVIKYGTGAAGIEKFIENLW